MKVVTAMFSTIVLMLLILMTVQAGCSHVLETPSDVIEEHVRLLNERNFDQFYDLHASGVLPAAKDAYLEEIEQLFHEGSEITDVRIINEEIDGDKAHVTWSSLHHYPGRDVEDMEVTTSLVMENGEWKIGEDATPSR